MENDKDNVEQKNYKLYPSIIIAALILAGAWIYIETLKNPRANQVLSSNEDGSSPFELPVLWDDLGAKLISTGVIDVKKFEALYENNLDQETKELLYGAKDKKLIISENNSRTILNLLWALGLAQKNEILESGEMQNPLYGGAAGFASTGGWTISKGNPMDHYSTHKFFDLTKEQQALVDKISSGIYRPCCGNSTHFPDCNHGMAMLGLLELMASQGLSEEEMWKVALRVNEFWFPDEYAAIRQYMNQKGISWDKADPKEVLGINYSSMMGYQNILKQIDTIPSGSGGGCGVETSAHEKQKSSGCGV